MNTCCQRQQAQITRAQMDFEYAARAASRWGSRERLAKLEQARENLDRTKRLADEHTAEHYSEEEAARA